MNERFESAFSERNRWIQRQFMLFQEVNPKATKAQLKKEFKRILKNTNNHYKNRERRNK